MRSEAASTWTHNGFRTAEVARLAGLDAERIRQMVRDGYCQVARVGRYLHFTFAEVVLFRNIARLLQAEVPARRIRGALRALAEQLPTDRALSAISLFAKDGCVMARANGQTWSPETGQAVLPFKPPSKRAVPPVELGPGWLHRADPEPLSGSAAAQWFNFALDHQDSTDDACDAYRRAIEVDPEFTDAYINLGRLEYERGNFDEAVALYCRAATFAPNDAVVRFNLAFLCEEQGDDADAAALYGDAVRLVPDFAEAHFNLGRVLDRIGRHAEAADHVLAYRQLTQG